MGENITAPVMGDKTSFIGTDRPKDKTLFDMLREFELAFENPINVPITQRLRILRYALIEEEANEALEELSFPHEVINKAKLTKELADLLYVVVGTGVVFGLPLEQAFKEVHRSNMSKLGPDGKPVRREDGKVLKGPNYSEANMEQFFG